MEDPPLDIDDLNDDTKLRISILDELIDLKHRMRVDKLRGKELETEYKERSLDAIWDARTWLYQKQSIDDFVLFTMISNLCLDNDVQMVFNLRQTFRLLL